MAPGAFCVHGIEMETERLKGLYLVPPHGELIATGAKSAIAKSKYVPGHRLFDLRGDWMLVSKVDGVGLGLGDMTLGEPVVVSLDEFDTKQSEHRVEKVDRMRWWPEYKTLWIYPIEAFKGYNEALRVDVPAGVQTVMSSVMRPGVDTGSPMTADKAYSSVAIALAIPPPVAKKLAVEGTPYEGGERQGVIPLDQLHLTLAYLGDVKELEKRRKLLQEGVAAFAVNNQEVSGEVKGRIVFDTPNGSAVCAHFDSPELPDFRQRLTTFLDNLGFRTKSEHGFTPHICLAYVDPGQEAKVETPTVPDVTLEKLSILWAGDRTDYQLKGTKVGTKETDMQEIIVLLDDEQLTGEKVYSKLSEANSALRGIKPPITLAQANLIASWADAMEAAEDGPKSPWGTSIAQFKELYEVNEAGDGWVERAKTGDKAKWSGAYIGSLPDTAFLLIESGGEKKDGITRPLSLRHLPVRGKDGAIDLGHLRNALARMSQMKDKEGNSFPAATIDKLREKARKLLAESQKARGEGQGVDGERQGDTGTGFCICSKCDHIVEHERGAPCNETKCEKCDALMRGATQAEIEAAGVQAGRAVVAAVATGVDASVKEGRRVRQDKVGLLQKLKDELNEFLVSLSEFVGWATYNDKPKDTEPEEFNLGTLLSAAGKKALEQGSTAFAFKALDGTTWWFQWTTNAFKDREGEIFTTQSISDFVDRKENQDVKGEFWFWHTPGSKFGTVRLQAIVGRFLAQAGPFDDTAVGRAFKEFFSAHSHSHPDIAPEGWGTSHSYSYKSTDRAVDGVYNWFDIKESTVLPLRFASNPYSPMPQILQEVKQMNKQQREAFAAIGGDDFVNLITDIGKESTKKLEGEVDFKEAKPEDEKAGGNYVARIKEIANGIEDEGLKGQVEVFCAKLEEAIPAAKKETDGAEAEDEKAKTDMASMAGQLRMLAGKVGGNAGEKLSAIAEEMATAYGKKEDLPVQAGAEATIEPKAEPEVEQESQESETKAANVLTREEVADAMKAVVQVLREEIKETTKATVAEITEALKPLVAEVKSLKEADEVKVAEKAAETPAASLSSLLQSVIGSKATFVDAASELAKSGPKETASPADTVTGIPFVDAFIGEADQASQKPTQ